MSYRRVTDGQGRALTMLPTGERSERVHVHVEPVKQPNGAELPRARVDAPVTLEPQRATVSPGTDLDEPVKLRLSKLDAALNPEEAKAFYRFYVGTKAGEGRVAISNYGQVTASSEPGKRQFFTERERHEISCRQYVWKRLPWVSQRDLQLLCMWVDGEGQAPIDWLDWAKQFGNTQDKRVAGGVFAGAMRKLIQHVAELQVEYEILTARKRAEKRAEAERKQLRRGNNLPEDEEEN